MDSTKKICPNCCWYDDDTDKCLHPKHEPDPDIEGRTGNVTHCSSFVQIEDDCFTTWFPD